MCLSTSSCIHWNQLHPYLSTLLPAQTGRKDNNCDKWGKDSTCERYYECMKYNAKNECEHKYQCDRWNVKSGECESKYACYGWDEYGKCSDAKYDGVYGGGKGKGV